MFSESATRANILVSVNFQCRRLRCGYWCIAKPVKLKRTYRCCFLSPFHRTSSILLKINCMPYVAYTWRCFSTSHSRSERTRYIHGPTRPAVCACVNINVIITMIVVRLPFRMVGLLNQHSKCKLLCAVSRPPDTPSKEPYDNCLSNRASLCRNGEYFVQKLSF